MVRRGGEETAVPESVMESISRTMISLEEMKPNLVEFLALAEPDVITELPPLQRAHALLLLAKSMSTLFTLRLRCSGVQPDDHAVKTELERLSLYEEKLHKYNDWSKAPSRPSTTINYQAATRFIEHSLPDLTPEQKQSMQDISKGEVGKSSLYENRNAYKKRKYQSSNKQSIRASAQEFLEKATRELLGAQSDLKGPLRDESSDE
ncbi:sas10/Utp3/C1D family [Tasmannia lanceolata]|uniref:sas10/Utp3/C1D family n=1 Tax=Tasmannia lanceolata TaxID=3420 RepID=UPI0040639FF2